MRLEFISAVNKIKLALRVSTSSWIYGSDPIDDPLTVKVLSKFIVSVVGLNDILVY